MRTGRTMARTFAYLRVSTPEQTTENQVQGITDSGFRVEPHRIVTETVSGSVAISQRPEFARLADRLEPGDVLVVTKLDRLGRNAMDVARHGGRPRYDRHQGSLPGARRCRSHQRGGQAHHVRDQCGG